MEMNEREIKDICIISVSGRMEAADAKELQNKLNSIMAKNVLKIIINLAYLEYISSSGLRVLLTALKNQKQKQGFIEVATLQPFVKKIFKKTGLDRVFIIHSDEEAAIRYLTPS